MRRIRVLVVYGSPVARGATVEALGTDREVEVVGTAGTAALAFAKTASLTPDVVVLDADLAEVDVVATVRALRRARPKVVLILVASRSLGGARATLDGLDEGVDDYVTKPPDDSAVAVQRMTLVHLLPRIKVLSRRLVPPAAPAAPAAPKTPKVVDPALAAVLASSGVDLGVRPPSNRPRTSVAYQVLVVGASTGGPEALAAVVKALPADLRIPVLVAQHMPPGFTKLLADRLTTLGPLEVAEATDGEQVRRGRVLVAPGGRHLELQRERGVLVARLSDAPPENFVRPSADVLFRTAVGVCGESVLALVLTGMGRDGEEGCRLVREAGGTVVVQDEKTSVVWGMPGAVARAGLADAVLPLPRIGENLVQRIVQRV